MRAFGFIPASEAGVLKRDWKGLKVRVSTDHLRVVHLAEQIPEVMDRMAAQRLGHGLRPVSGEVAYRNQLRFFEL